MKKKIIVLLGLAIALVVIILIFVSCKDSTTAETSAVGSTVAETAASTTVAEAAASTAVAGDTSSCTDCHNDTTVIFSKEVQYSNSVHGTGLNFERNAADCARCHTSEGFTARIAAGTFEIAEDATAIQNASPINCRTCHNIHVSYTEADWALKTADPVTLELTGDVYDKGSSNLCANCHQPRPETAVPVAGGAAVEIKSTRYGPHHGPQSSMLLGVGGYGEYKGSNVHYDATKNGCIDCHMTDSAFGKQSGGHTLKMTYTFHEAETEFLAGCLKCHEDIESFDRNGVETEIAAMIEELRAHLVKDGLIDDKGAGIVGTFTADQAGALWNYKTVTEDRSNGLHNPGYAKFLLQTGIDALKK
ncbi:MAG: hypothetical protein ACYDIA_09360 [Candidatus Humimicrobiaceae bacterium]